METPENPQEQPAPAPEAAAPETVTDTAPETVTEAAPDTSAQPAPVTAPAAEPAPDATAEAPAEAADAPAPEKDASGDEPHYTFKQFLCDAADVIESVTTAIFVVMLVFTYLICTAVVEGDSMVPTLENGDRLMVSRLDKTYETGDILILNSASAYTFDDAGQLTAAPGLGKRIVKRLIAQSGQEVNIDFDEGIVYVDGKALEEPYTSTLTKRDNRAFTYPLTVPEGYVFVLGDNRHISKDSRHPEVGMIAEEDIIGRVLIRVAPLYKFGRIDSTGGQQAESQRD